MRDTCESCGKPLGPYPLPVCSECITNVPADKESAMIAAHKAGLAFAREHWGRNHMLIIPAYESEDERLSFVAGYRGEMGRMDVAVRVSKGG